MESKQFDPVALQARAENYPLMTVPAGSLRVCAGVDVLADRFEVALWAFGNAAEMWALGYAVIPANPADEQDWQKLWQILQTPLPRHCGALATVACAAIDTGGHFTQQAYAFVTDYAPRSPMQLLAVKGNSYPGAPIQAKRALVDLHRHGRILRESVELFFVGCDAAKDQLYKQLAITQPGPGYVHLSQNLPPEFFSGLASETLSTDAQTRCTKTGARSEPLDCTVGAIFASCFFGV